MLEIPYQKVSPQALKGLIEEFVLRENAESGHSEHDVADLAEIVLKKLQAGRVVLVFDPESETHSIIESD